MSFMSHRLRLFLMENQYKWLKDCYQTSCRQSVVNNCVVAIQIGMDHSKYFIQPSVFDKHIVDW